MTLGSLAVLLIATAVVSALFTHGLHSALRRDPEERVEVITDYVAIPGKAVYVDRPSDEMIQEILELHYRDVYYNPEMQKLWRKILRTAAAERTLKGAGK
jgi:hypothetical protein